MAAEAEHEVEAVASTHDLALRSHRETRTRASAEDHAEAHRLISACELDASGAIPRVNSLSLNLSA